MLPVLVHIHLLQRLIHPLADHGTGYAQVFRAEGHILLHHIGNNLVIRVLENHAHLPADGDDSVLLGSVHAAHIHFAPAGKQNGIEMLGQSGFSAAVAAQNGHKRAFFNGNIQVLKYGNAGRVVHARILICQMFCLYSCIHTHFSRQGVHLPVAPQGSTRPEAVTGRPNSPTAVLPPWSFPNTTLEA